MKIEPGDIIVVRVGYIVRAGVVKTAQNYGTEDQPNWYIEFESPVFGPVYWKQGIDGGTILSVQHL